MKKVTLLLVLFLMMYSATFYAKEVNLAEARKIACKAYFQRLNDYYSPVSFPGVIIEDETVVRNGSRPAYYIFNIKDYGFIIISAEDAMVPVLGYSFDNQYVDGKYAPNFQSLLDSYGSMIEYLRLHHVQADEYVQKKWDEIRNLVPGQYQTGKEIVVDALIQSTWGQGSPYNYFCPQSPDVPGGKAITGCVATCMVQIMYYWRWPDIGTGSHSYFSENYGMLSADFGDEPYDYDGMADYISMPASYPAAVLNYEAGVSVDMNYSPDGSGAYSTDVDDAFRNYFKFSNSCEALERYNYTYAVWTGMIYSELDAGHPLYYSGYSNSGGHAFVLDGYTNDDEFHFNFGWDGYANGWFPHYNPQGYSDGQVMVRHIVPAASETYPPEWSGVKNIPYVHGIIDDGSGPVYDYASNTNRGWLIDPALSNQNTEYITLDIIEMDIADDDLLSIYDGEDESAPLLGSYNGSTLPSTITSSGGKVFIKFVSDGQNNGEGFRVRYTAHLAETCSAGNVLNDLSGTISDNSGDFDYKNGSSCNWIIEPPEVTQIALEITEFNTQEGGDRLLVYDGETFACVDTLTGEFTNLPLEITYDASKLVLVFKTDELITDEGWTLNYSGLVGVEEEIATGEALSVSPNPASEYIDVALNIASPSVLSLSLLTVDGKKVYGEILSSKENTEYSYRIPVDNLAKGIYLLKAVTEKGVLTRKVVVQ